MTWSYPESKAAPVNRKVKVSKHKFGFQDSGMPQRREETKWEDNVQLKYNSKKFKSFLVSMDDE